MKNLIRLFTAAIVITLMAAQTYACDFSMDVTNGAKKVYEKGNTLTVTATAELTHNPCKHELSDIKFVTDGVQIVSQGKWIEDEDGNFTKSIKLKITAANSKNASLQIYRKCKRGGGDETLKFKVK